MTYSSGGAEPTSTPVSASPPAVRASGPRPLLWLLLVVSLACNVVSSTAGYTWLGIGAGLGALASGTALIAHHYRHRRS
ncbi:hypothetical protein [Streptomyces heilongjiangensis]|uniref:Secreted protein n=1 Tax=Streptomyces heilongjiangensis TaxID=945052 RepID=A0ABW1AYT3_9ACTN|nr:hypothetical protein [Streptomyces heilongjiangensis]MDC2951435.1 hypothetical protein [Streptomyces heilongjiangensis]